MREQFFLHLLRPFFRGAGAGAAIRVALALAALLVSPLRTISPQTATDSADASVCFGFSFGAWTPALDWTGAGHQTAKELAHVPDAPGGRGWAAPLDSTSERARRSIMLFPSWWPAGVDVRVDAPPVAPGDTVTGDAIALVADGRMTPPLSRVRVWRVACKR